MIYASTRLTESDGTKVFVDSSGRRKRILALFGGVSALAALAYIGVVIASVVQAPQADLTNKATVSTNTTASATATASTTASASTTATASPSATASASASPAATSRAAHAPRRPTMSDRPYPFVFGSDDFR